MIHAQLAGGIIVGHDGRIVLIEQQNSLNRWSFPKGHLEPGETPLDTAVREIKEECGLTLIELVGLLGEIVRQGNDPKREKKHIQMFHFRTTEKVLEVRDVSANASINAIWVTLTKAQELLHPVDAKFLHRNMHKLVV